MLFINYHNFIAILKNSILLKITTD